MDLAGLEPGGRYRVLRSSSTGAAGGGAIPNNELPRRGAERTIVFKVQYVPGGEDLVTVWLNPDLSAGATELLQLEALTTRFNANASFDEVRLRHGGGGEGWVFSDLSIATAFTDFVDPSSAMPRTAEDSPFFDLRRLGFRSWQREPGMPRGVISSVAQTLEGYLWLAAGSELSRFDGVRFVRVEVPALEAGGVVWSLFGDSQGALWIGTDRGVVRYAEGRFEFIRTGQGLPSDTVTGIVEDQQNRIWLGTTLGLAVWDGGALRAVPGAEIFEGCDIRALGVDHNGVLWMGVAGRGVFRYDGTDFLALTDSEFDDLLRDPQCLVVDHEGRVWLGVGNDLVLCREAKRWHRYRIPNPSRTPHVRALVEDADGTVWAASASEGLVQFREDKLVSLNSGTGLLDNQASALFRDRNGQLWVGGGSGLHLLRQRHCFKLGQAEGLGHGPVAAVAEVSPGVIWAMQPGRGLYRWEGRSFRRLTAAGIEAGDPDLGAMLVTRDGACWIACANGLLLVRDPQAVADESQLFELPGVRISCLREGADGSLWAGTVEGQLWRLTRGRWVRHPGLDATAALTSLALATNGSVWVGTDGDGLYLADEQRLIRFGAREITAGVRIRVLHRDPQSVLWMATEGDGLLRLNNNRLTRYASAEGLTEETLLGVLEDRLGRIWLSDSSGLTCVLKPEPDDAPLEVLETYPMATARAETGGLAESHAPVFPKACATAAGRLWFPVGDGVLVVEPPEMEDDSAPPALILETVLVDGVQLAAFRPRAAAGHPGAVVSGPRQEYRIGPGRHRVELQFTSPQFVQPERLRFRYRLEGLDQDWVEAGSGRSALYNYLPHGQYEFTVAVLGPRGATRQLVVGLSVAPYFWQRGWVIAAMVLGMFAVVGGGVRFVEKRRMSHRLRRLEQEHALERERTRIAQDLHDEMGARLCRISYMSEHAARLEPQSGELKEQVGTIAGDARELLQSLDQIVWLVNPQNDTLEHLASYMGQYAQHYFEGTDVECVLDLSGDFPHLPISSQARHHLLLAVHEALTNVLKHSGATRVEVVIRWNGSSLTIDIQDNGRGFAVPPAGTMHQDSEGTGNGVRNMRARLAAVGGQCRVDSSPGCGTHIQFQMFFQPPNKKRQTP
jgi:signal transduction histidine kinase/ligand-binding sensor domain-containing protein